MGRCLLKGGKYVMGASFTSIFNFMLDLLSHMNDKEKQQVYGCIRVHLVYGNSFSGNFHG